MQTIIYKVHDHIVVY